MSLSDLRERLQDNPKVYYGTIVALSVLCLSLVARWFMAPSGGTDLPTFTHTFFYDVNTKKLYSVPMDTDPPAKAPSGAGAGVRAHVFVCGDCSDVSKHFTSYLQSRMTLKTSTQETGKRKAMMDSQGGLVDVVRAPDEKEWVPISSKHGLELMGRAQKKCIDLIPPELKPPILKNDDPDPDLSRWRLLRCEPAPKQ